MTDPVVVTDPLLDLKKFRVKIPDYDYVEKSNGRDAALEEWSQRLVQFAEVIEHYLNEARNVPDAVRVTLQSLVGDALAAEQAIRLHIASVRLPLLENGNELMLMRVNADADAYEVVHPSQLFSGWMASLSVNVAGQEYPVFSSTNVQLPDFGEYDLNSSDDYDRFIARLGDATQAALNAERHAATAMQYSRQSGEYIDKSRLWSVESEKSAVDSKKQAGISLKYAVRAEHAALSAADDAARYVRELSYRFVSDAQNWANTAKRYVNNIGNVVNACERQQSKAAEQADIAENAAVRSSNSAQEVRAVAADVSHHAQSVLVVRDQVSELSIQSKHYRDDAKESATKAQDFAELANDYYEAGRWVSLSSALSEGNSLVAYTKYISTGISRMINADNVHEKVSQLTLRATELLDQYTTLKRGIEVHVSTSSDSARDAETSKVAADEVLEQIQKLKLSLEALSSDARELVNSAVAVTYGEGASANASAGGIPVANAEGRIDKGWLPDDWDELTEVLASVASNAKHILKLYERYYGQDKTLKSIEVDVSGLSKTLIKLQGALNTNNKDLQDLVAQVQSLGAVMAWQAESEAVYRRTMGQTGIFGVRQYTHHGHLRQPHTENGQPAHMHNHVEYRDLCGSGEVQFVVNGYLGATRHRDYHLYRTADQGSQWLETQFIESPARPSSVEVGTTDQRIEAMRDLFKRYDAGEFPQGFGWTLSALECWVEPFTESINDAFASERHQQEVDSVTKALRQLIRFSAGGMKNRFENLSMEVPFVRWLDASGKPQIGILKHRMICVDVSQLGDLRPHIEEIDDTLREAGWGSKTNRFKVKELRNSPGKLDEMMSLLPGLNGTGATLTEEYNFSGTRSHLNNWSGGQRLNAAYYSRAGKMLDDDAANMRHFFRSFNDPYLFAAVTTRPEVMNTAMDGIDYRFSYAIPMELILRTPLEGWNPHGIPWDGSVKHESGLGAAESSALSGYNNHAYYLTPEEFYSGDVPQADPADTFTAPKWITGADGQAHLCRGAGQWVEYPSIVGIERRIRKRYAIFPEHQEGGKAWMYAESLKHEMTGLLALEASNTKDVLLQSEGLFKLNKQFTHLAEQQGKAIDDLLTSVERRLDSTDSDNSSLLAAVASNTTDIIKNEVKNNG